jgi:very-short-patch-repair endonuclease
VNRTLHRLLTENHGIVHRTDILRHVDHAVLDRAVARGQLLRPYASVYIDPAHAGDYRARVRAALVYARATAAVSHLTALVAWRLPVPSHDRVHLLTGTSHHLRGAQGLVVHRGVGLKSSDVVTRNGWPVTRLERTLVDCWPMLDGDARRAPCIQAVAERMTTAARVRAALEEVPRLGGRRLLVELLELLHRGCRSSLELWGYAHVFRGPGLSGLRWQVPVRLGARTVYLDVYDDATRTNFELDSAKYHAHPRDRDRDLRRDAALATLGITVVRFSHERLVREPYAVSTEVSRILLARAGTLAA